MRYISDNIRNMKPNSRALTLQLLFRQGVLSRTDIARFLHITTAAVTSIVNSLIDIGLLITSDESIIDSQRVGRHRSALQIDYNWKYILAVDIHSYYINIAVTNLRGEVICEGEPLVPEADDPGTLCSSIAKECIKMLWKTSVPTEMVLGAGITIIGPVNQDKGIALHPFRLFDGPVPLKQYFEAEFPFPVAVESNVCALLLSELLYNDLPNELQNILMLKWGPGVGSAMAIHRQVYKGYGFQSTEIGHNQIAEKGGKLCNCGQTGCLEPLISTDAMANFIIQNSAKNPSGMLAQMIKRIGTPTRKNLFLFIDEMPDELIRFIRSCAHELAAVTNNAIHILAPDKLILIGDLMENDMIFDIFTEELYSINPRLPSDHCIKYNSTSDKRYIGATAVAIDRILLGVSVI